MLDPIRRRALGVKSKKGPGQGEFRRYAPVIPPDTDAQTSCRKFSTLCPQPPSASMELIDKEQAAALQLSTACRFFM
jgi:hypothetical protein